LPVRRGVGVAQFAIKRDANTAEMAEAVGDKIKTLSGVFSKIAEATRWRKTRLMTRPRRAPLPSVC
jgi:hypothetical protein